MRFLPRDSVRADQLEARLFGVRGLPQGLQLGQRRRKLQRWNDRELIPVECGLIIADPFGAAILREAELRPLNAARRRAITLRFALAGAQRLRRLLDPGAGDPGAI